MKLNASPFRLSLQWGRPLTVADGKGTCITARRGSVWITQENDLRDVVLSSGECFVLDHRDLAVVQALETAEILVVPPAPRLSPAATPNLPQRFLQAWRRGSWAQPGAVR